MANAKRTATKAAAAGQQRQRSVSRARQTVAQTTTANCTGQSTSSAADDESMDVDVVGRLVKLKTNDGKRFTFTESEATCSKALCGMLESSRENATNEQTEYIELDSIDGQTLANVLKWCKQQNGDYQLDTMVNADNVTAAAGRRDNLAVNAPAHSRPSAIDGREPTDAVSQQTLSSPVCRGEHQSFLYLLSEIDLLKLIHAANFLDAKSLLDDCCQIVAKRWEGKKVEEIRKLYKIVGDFAPDEEYTMILENKKLGLPE